jgi:hypothetical protein
MALLCNTGFLKIGGVEMWRGGLGAAYLLPALSSAGASIASPCFRFHIPLRPKLASNTAGSGRGPRYLAQAKALSVGLSNAYLKSLGLPTLHEEC